VNEWDVLTWLSAAALAASAVVIFIFFLRDAGKILDRQHDDHDER
jgi:hypothetical protein